MKFVIVLGLLLMCSYVLYNIFVGQGRKEIYNPNPSKELPEKTSTTIKIESSAFTQDGTIPRREFTCDGVNGHPPVSFLDVPADAKSLVLIVEDPDVPKDIRPDGMFDHWIVFNILASVKSIEMGIDVPGTPGLNGRGKPGYTGPCPPDKEHRYFFKLFALDALLDLPENSDKTAILDAMKGHIVDEAQLIGRYARAAK